MSQIIQDFNARLALLGWTKQELAEKVHKDISTVSKQLDPKSSNPQLSTLELFASVMGGELHYSTPESVKAIEDSNVKGYRNRLGEMGTEIAYLKERVAYLERQLEEKAAKIARRDETMEELHRIIAKKEEVIEEKDRIIARKDARLSQFIDKFMD